MEFHKQRRQQFLGEGHYRSDLAALAAGIEDFSKAPAGSGLSEGEGWLISRRTVARQRFERLSLRYTAGESIEALRVELGQVVEAYERYGEQLWKLSGDRNDWVFDFDSLDEYCRLLQIVGLCFLLHRRDLMPRIAALQDGLDAVGRRGEGNGGADWLYEEFMAFAMGAENRFETDLLRCSKPYEALADAMGSADNDVALKDLHRYLKRWYKDLSGTGWHDSHKPDEAGNQGGYYGYWSFEAGAAVLLLGIEDDSSLHQYLCYPKDLVTWAREHRALSGSDDAGSATASRLRCEGGQLCPREGWWSTPARSDSRRLFKQGEPMPDFQSDWGDVIWQWDESQ